MDIIIRQVLSNRLDKERNDKSSSSYNGNNNHDRAVQDNGTKRSSKTGKSSLIGNEKCIDYILILFCYQNYQNVIATTTTITTITAMQVH